MYNWDEMSEQQRDLLIIQTFGFNYNIVDFQPTCDMSDAWEVIEKMEADGWRFDLSTYQSGTDLVGTNFVQMMNGSWSESAASTAPEAICKAALKAVGVEIE